MGQKTTPNMASPRRSLATLSALGFLLLCVPSCSGKNDSTGSETSSDSGAVGASCSPDSPCGSDGYCDYADDLCGTGEPTGTCVALPNGCESGDPVSDCGCNGTVAADACFLALDRTDVSLLGNCTGETSDSDSDSDTGSDSGAVGFSCSPDSPCNEDGYCDYADNLCGTGEPTGKCVARPNGCESGDIVYDCGCNGALEPDECFLGLKYTDVSLLENCTDNTFRACGATYCTIDYPCITYIPEEGEPTKSCGPDFVTECELDCDCLLIEHPECTECAVEDGRLVVSCAL